MISSLNPPDGPRDTDVHAMAIEHVVAVTPLSLDMTSRLPMDQLDSFLRKS